MTNNEQLEKLNTLEKQVKKLSDQKVVKETELKLLREQRDEIVKTLKEMNVDPVQLSTKIQEMEVSIATQLKEIEEQIPDNIK